MTLTRPMAHRFVRMAMMLILGLLLWKLQKVGGINADFIFFTVAGIVWFVASVLIEWGVFGYQWSEKIGRTLIASLDGYCLALCFGLAQHGGGLAIRALGVYCLILALICGALPAALAGLAGMLAFLTVCLITELDWHSGLALSGLTALAAVVCGAAWQVTAPTVWKALQAWTHGASGAAQAGTAATQEPADELAAAFAAAAAPAAKIPNPPAPEINNENALLTQQIEELRALITERETTLATVTQEKNELGKELEKATEEIMKMFSNTGESAPAPTASAALPADVISLQKALDAMTQEKEAVSKELEKATDEIMKMFENAGGPPPAPAAAPVDAPSADVAALQKALDAITKEKDAVAKELEKTTDELMKVFGNIGEAPTASHDLDKQLETMKTQLAEKEAALEAAKKENSALTQELAKTNEEMMTLFK